jgi:hypothetical protein
MMNDPESPTQVWTTAQMLKAMLTGVPQTPIDAAKVRNALGYIESGQIKTSPYGWGYFDGWQPGVTEIAGWVCVAQAASLRRDATVSIWNREETEKMEQALKRTVQLLVGSQQNDGGWGPTAELGSPRVSRTYSTVLGLWCLLNERRAMKEGAAGHRADHSKGIDRLLATYRARNAGSDGPLGWVPHPGRRLRTSISWDLRDG